MLTYTLKLIYDYKRYLDACCADDNVFTFLAQELYEDENKEVQTFYLIYNLERDGKPIDFLRDKHGSILWRKEEEELP